MIDEFPHVARAARESLVGRMLRGAAEHLTRAWVTSRCRRHVRVLASHLAAEPAAERLRTAALVIAAAAVWHLLLAESLPVNTTSGLPWWWSVVGVAVPLAVAALAVPLAAAWASSRLGRS